MTPKEKAKDIYDKMKGFRVKNSHRKKCALIAVEEILNAREAGTTGVVLDREYWEEVKKEIENI